MPETANRDIYAEIEKWRSNLLDTTKRNRLINFKSGQSGGVNIVFPGADAVWDQLLVGNGRMTFVWKRDLVDEPNENPDGEASEGFSLLADDGGDDSASTRVETSRCLDSSRLDESHLLTDLTDKKLASRLGSLDLNARTALSEMGVTTLYLVFGFLRWFERSDSQIEYLAPLLLVPARLDRENIESPWTLGIEDQEVGSNHSLLQLLKSDFDIQFPPIPEEFQVEAAHARHGYFEQVSHCIRRLPRWEVVDKTALGVFNFQKVAMWEDLGKNRGKISSHGLCRAIAGDRGSMQSNSQPLLQDRELDHSTRPEQTFHILDCDSSQHAAIEAAKEGASFVLDGPPGTGKSQTIANIIGESLASGKSVLFVSEKSAALEVVKRRLDARGLGDFCLECHSHKANKKTVIAELGRCLNLGPETYPDREEDLSRLFETRARLNAYVVSLHTKHQPLGISAFEAHGRLANIRGSRQTRCRLPDPMRVDSSGLRRMTELLNALLDCRGAIDDYTKHPWRGVRHESYSLGLRDDVAHHIGRIARLTAAIKESSPLLSHLGFAPDSPTLIGWQRALREALEAQKLPLLPANWFDINPQGVALLYKDLYSLSKRSHDLWSTMPEISRERLREAGPHALGGFALPREGAFFSRLARPSASIREQTIDLDQVVQSLRKLAERTSAVQAAMDRLTKSLQIPARPLPLRKIANFLEQLNLMSKMGSARRSWLDPSKRQELQRVLPRCQDNEAANAQLRVTLAARLKPSAFSHEAESVVARAASFKSVWSRLLPGWRECKAELARLYVEGLPPTSVLLGDLKDLSSFHRRSEDTRQVIQEYEAGLLVSSAGQIEWTRTLQCLKTVEQLSPLLSSYPGLGDALIEPGRLNHQMLRDAIQDLHAAYLASREQYKVTEQMVALGGLLEAGSQEAVVSVSDFVSRLEAEAKWLERRRETLDQFGGILKPGLDLPIDQISERVETIRQLNEIGLRIEDCKAKLANLLPAKDSVDELDIERHATNGSLLLEFLGKYDGEPPEHFVSIMTRGEVRAALDHAVRSNLISYTKELAESWNYLKTLFPIDTPISTGITLASASVDALALWSAQRAGDVPRLQEWLKFGECRRLAKDLGLDALLAEVVQKVLPLDDVNGAFLTRFYRGWLDAVYAKDNALRQFDSDAHERIIDEFRSLDLASVKFAPNRIRQTLLSDPARPNATRGDAPGASELGTLLQEVHKKARHLPLRHLFARTPTLMRRLKPCLMMSPLAVSTYLVTEEMNFDLVIFDEASQVRPEDAISSIYRGKQLIVAGDQKQLPPTNFFGRAIEDSDLPSDSEDASEVSLDDYESILDVCCTLGLPRRRLRWHYRSRREPLIAFSNRHFYDNDLVSFPSILDVDSNRAIRFEYLPDGCWLSGRAGGYNLIEARRTAELVFNHFRENPAQSLGVIAFSQRQQTAIYEALEMKRRHDPSMEDFFDLSRAEAFFVKNLENVQGDERDVIFLSIAYGPDENRKVAMRFGPLNQKGGERRLNVAVTRARESMTVISSLRALDIDLSRSNAVGVKLLRAYLDFAERGPEALRSEITADGEREFESPFEKEVAEELTRRGMVVHRQIGCGGFRIDLALMDPDRPGHYVLGVECDGATYHSSATARDRDRLRQSVLESLGWRISRIWSTDWAHNPTGQIDRVLAAFEAARESFDNTKIEPESPSLPESEVIDFPFTQAKTNEEIVQLEIPSFRTIDDVPKGTIRELLSASLLRFGTTLEGELIKSVARQLGFKKTGSRINARITACLEELVKDGGINRVPDGNVRLSASSNSRHG